MNICQKERIFFFTHAIKILYLFTYSVCDEKVKIKMDPIYRTEIMQINKFL